MTDKPSDHLSLVPASPESEPKTAQKESKGKRGGNGGNDGGDGSEPPGKPRKAKKKRAWKKYKPKYAATARVLVQERGFTQIELARHFNVGPSTITRWRGVYPEFHDALNVPRELATERVRRSLYERATGYSFDSEKVFCTKYGQIVRAPTVTHLAPDVRAAQLWLEAHDRETFGKAAEKRADRILVVERVRVPTPAERAAQDVAIDAPASVDDDLINQAQLAALALNG